MDTLTHALTSVALARAGQKHLPRYGAAMLVVAGVAPDLDYLSYFGGPSAFLRFHRALLHSLLGSALIACVIAAIFWAVAKKRSQERKFEHSDQATTALRFKAALAVCAIGLGGHLLLDLASGIGVQAFWPFRVGWQAWDLLANLDPWILIVLIAGLLLPELFRLVSEEIGEPRKRARGKGAAIVTLILLLAYVGARANLHSHAIKLLQSREYHDRAPLMAAAFPASSTPFNWRGVVATEDTIEEINISLLPGAEFDPDRSHTLFKPEPSAALDAGERTAAAARFLTYARFPFASVRRVDDGYRFELRDLRFPVDDSALENIFVRVDLNEKLQIEREEFRYASSNSP